jgi:protein-S-isoprenylcysteine O-methyltransferase
LATVAAVMEYFFESYWFPSFKTYGWNVYIGIVIVGLSQMLRSSAMITCGSNFNHYVQHTKDENHKLVTHGIYSVLRHPSYTGFFYWGVGMQILLFNPICVILYAYALFKFFSERIPTEEEHLIDFFPEYKEYRRKTYVLIPFLI